MRLRAPGAEIEVRAQPGSNPGHHDRVCAGIPRWPPARRTPDVPRQDLGSLIAELAQQPARPGRDPEGEVPAAVLTELQLGDPGQKLIEDSLTTRSYFWQCTSAAAALARASSPAQTQQNPQEQEGPANGHAGAVGGIERYRHSVACIDMRTRHAILPWRTLAVGTRTM